MPFLITMYMWLTGAISNWLGRKDEKQRWGDECYCDVMSCVRGMRVKNHATSEHDEGKDRCVELEGKQQDDGNKSQV